LTTTTASVPLRDLDGDVLLTDHEAAAYLRMQVKALRFSLRDGRLPATKAGRHWRIRAADLRAYLERRRTGPAAEAG
jgi:excisionase family DNA binding protein